MPAGRGPGVFINSIAYMVALRLLSVILKDFKALLGKSKYEQDKGVDIPQTVDAVKKWVVEG